MNAVKHFLSICIALFALQALAVDQLPQARKQDLILKSQPAYSLTQVSTVQGLFNKNNEAMLTQKGAEPVNISNTCSGLNPCCCSAGTYGLCMSVDACQGVGTCTTTATPGCY
jgi:hypothetical protein